MHEAKDKRTQRVLLTIEGGGFFWQSRSVARALAGEFELAYVSSSAADEFPDSGLPDAPWHRMTKPTSVDGHSYWRDMRNVWRGIWQAVRLIRETDPDAIVCVATSMAVPLCFCGRIFGKKTVFIESITRVSNPSTTGRILSTLRLCNRLYVQWPEAQSLYRNAVYRGAVL